MNKYQGDEQNNPILEFIRNHSYPADPNNSLELANLQNTYQLWNAAKLGVVPFLASREAQEWFGHSLFTANVKMYQGYRLLLDMSNLFLPDPRRPVIPAPQFSTYEVAPLPYSDPELQIERYSSFSTFLWHLSGALDVMTVGLAFLYDFEQIRADFCPSFAQKIRPLRIDFHIGVSLLRQADRAMPVSGKSKPVNLIDTYKVEGLLDLDPATSKTRCDWYENLRIQRNYYTHLGFPFFYVDKDGWRVPKDARGPAPAANLTDFVHDFCYNLFRNVHRFIGAVYSSAWADFGPYLPS